MTARPAELRILVCGASDRGDDGAALAAISRMLPTLPEAVRSRIEVRRCSELQVSDLVSVTAGEACLVVDTVGGIEPGSLIQVTLADLANPTDGLTLRSARALSVEVTFLIAEAVCGAMPQGLFVGIGGRWFGYGERFSRVVKAELPAFGEAIRVAILDLHEVPA